MNLRCSDVDLKQVLNEATKTPEIMKNALKCAIERQNGRIVFLNIILENISSVLTLLSEYKHLDLTFKNAIDDAVKLLNDDSLYH